MRLLTQGGKNISDWRSWTRPKKDYQWRAGRSAMELARAWFTSPEPCCPPEISALLASHPSTSGLELVEAIPECVTRLPERGEGRNHDLLVLGQKAGKTAVVSVESKSDEPFGEAIGKYWKAVTTSKHPTRAPERIEALLWLVFGASATPVSSAWGDLRYQLLTAVAGTAIEAARRRADLAVFIVHEFRTENIRKAAVTRNARDYARFVAALMRQTPDRVGSDHLYGPARLSKGKYLERDVEVLVGKVVYDWSADPASHSPIRL